MTEDFTPEEAFRSEGRKPTIAIMGEFSAGKSSLTNLLIGGNPLPVKVTATQLPPVRISQGQGDPFREDFDREQWPIELEAIDDVDPAETRLIQIFQQADILDLCHLIDTPGISDPNMSLDEWSDVLEDVDGVIWCTHATQAWRQSEAAVWTNMPPELHEKSILLVTRIDKLLTDEDRKRVLKRVKRETDGLFIDRLPIALADALAAEDDKSAWIDSGAEAFSERFVDLLNSLANGEKPRPASDIPAPTPLILDTPADAAPAHRVVPRRVTLDRGREGRTTRPVRADDALAWPDLGS